MQIRELAVADSFELTPIQRRDDRGIFLEWYRFDLLEEAIGHSLTIRQGNTSVSRKGVVRGIHFAEVPLGQAKYVTAIRGAVIDFIVDVRLGSPTFGQWDSVLLDGVDRRAVYLAEGLGHAFVSLEDQSTVSYLVSDVYTPTREHGINPLDPAIGLTFPAEIGVPLISPKDEEAPTLAEAERLGLLPDFHEVRSFYSSLATVGR